MHRRRRTIPVVTPLEGRVALDGSQGPDIPPPPPDLIDPILVYPPIGQPTVPGSPPDPGVDPQSLLPDPDPMPGQMWAIDHPPDPSAGPLTEPPAVPTLIPGIDPDPALTPPDPADPSSWPVPDVNVPPQDGTGVQATPFPPTEGLPQVDDPIPGYVPAPIILGPGV